MEFWRESRTLCFEKSCEDSLYNSVIIFYPQNSAVLCLGNHLKYMLFLTHCMPYFCMVICPIFFGDSGKKAMTWYEIRKSLIDF